MDARSRRQTQGRPGPELTQAGQDLRPGQRAEILACRYLRARGLKLLAANYRCRYGELDLVMRDGAVLAVIEVRARRSDRYGAPEASLTARKVRCLTRAARCFIHDHPQFGGMMLRFDVVGILGRGNRPRIRWIRNALQFDGR